MHRSKKPYHSITSSARASSVGGTERPSALAVWGLMTSSNFVGCMIGRSTGLAPSWARVGLRILENLRNEYVLAYNLTRVMNIIGIQPLITAMRA
jgi:hypothetical protein